jgi:hypothetical protein
MNWRFSALSSDMNIHGKACIANHLRALRATGLYRPASGK